MSDPVCLSARTVNFIGQLAIFEYFPLLFINFDRYMSTSNKVCKELLCGTEADN